MNVLYSELKKLAIISKTNKGYMVRSEKGKNLGGPYASYDLAKARLNEVEMFKHMKNKRKKKNAAIELRLIAKDLRASGELELAEKVICALAAVTGSNEPKADLSYSAIMRDLRQNNDAKVNAFQKAFKEVFDEAIDNEEENAESLALMSALQVIDKDVCVTADYCPRFEKYARLTLDMGDPMMAGKGIADIVRFLMKRVPDAIRPEMMRRLKTKVVALNENQISGQNFGPGSAMGQSITFIKNVLMGHNPAYIRQVLRYVASGL